jgi:hypothetical protein
MNNKFKLGDIVTTLDCERHLRIILELHTTSNNLNYYSLSYMSDYNANTGVAWFDNELTLVQRCGSIKNAIGVLSMSSV